MLGLYSWKITAPATQHTHLTPVLITLTMLPQLAAASFYHQLVDSGYRDMRMHPTARAALPRKLKRFLRRSSAPARAQHPR